MTQDSQTSKTILLSFVLLLVAGRLPGQTIVDRAIPGLYRLKIAARDESRVYEPRTVAVTFAGDPSGDR